MHKPSNNRFHLFNSSKYVAVFDGFWIMLQEGQKNSTAELIIALHFQHCLSFDRRLLFALFAYLLYCAISSHVFLDPGIQLFMVPDGKRAAIVGINLLINMLKCLLSSRTCTVCSNLIEVNLRANYITLCREHYMVRYTTYLDDPGLVPKVNKDGDNHITKNIIFFYFSKKLHFLWFASVNKCKDHKNTKACIKSR